MTEGKKGEELEGHVKTYVLENVTFFNNREYHNLVAFKEHLKIKGYEDWNRCPQYTSKAFKEWAERTTPEERNYDSFVVYAAGFMDKLRELKAKVVNKAKNFFGTKLSADDRKHALDTLKAFFDESERHQLKQRDLVIVKKYAQDLCDEGRDVLSDVNMQDVNKTLVILRDSKGAKGGLSSTAKPLFDGLLNALKKFEEQGRTFSNYGVTEVGTEKTKIRTISEFLCGLEKVIDNIQFASADVPRQSSELSSFSSIITPATTPPKQLEATSPVKEEESIPVKYEPIYSTQQQTPSPVDKPKQTRTKKKRSDDPTEKLQRGVRRTITPAAFEGIRTSLYENVAMITNTRMDVVQKSVQYFDGVTRGIQADKSITPEVKEFLLSEMKYLKTMTATVFNS